MLKAPDHQVAGHFASAGQLGPLVDGKGLFYKPLQNNERGADEMSFYTSFSSDPRVPSPIRRFFLSFHGTQLLPASNGSGSHHPHLILDDLTADLAHPSIIDFKIGSRTWAPSQGSDCTMASEVYGGSDGVLAQLLELKAWFKDQTIYHFYSVSVLMMYESGEEKGKGKARVKLVDFAHAVEGDGVIDHNFLGGLCSLIKFVSEVLTDQMGVWGRRVR